MKKAESSEKDYFSSRLHRLDSEIHTLELQQIELQNDVTVSREQSFSFEHLASAKVSKRQDQLEDTIHESSLIEVSKYLVYQINDIIALTLP